MNPHTETLCGIVRSTDSRFHSRLYQAVADYVGESVPWGEGFTAEPRKRTKKRAGCELLHASYRADVDTEVAKVLFADWLAGVKPTTPDKAAMALVKAAAVGEGPRQLAARYWIEGGEWCWTDGTIVLTRPALPTETDGHYLFARPEIPLDTPHPSLQVLRLHEFCTPVPQRWDAAQYTSHWTGEFDWERFGFGVRASDGTVMRRDVAKCLISAGVSQAACHVATPNMWHYQFGRWNLYAMAVRAPQ